MESMCEQAAEPSIASYTVRLVEPLGVLVHLAGAGRELGARDVQDEGLRGAAILPGDVAIYDRARPPRPGYPVLVWLGGDSCVARLYAVGPDGPELRATRPDYPTLRARERGERVNHPGEEGVVMGTIVGLVRAPGAAYAP